jgi:hypothetical protein
MGLYLQYFYIPIKIPPLQGFKASEMRHFGSSAEDKVQEPHPG